ncbi:MAG: hypothetical protein GXY70_06290 [Euryarchaeota archaeon]|nr:hypothetical protein [Euryarchaeota archaeon]
MRFPLAPPYLKAIALFVFMVLGLSALIIPAGIQGALTPSEEAAVAERFAPQYYFHGDEELYPVDIETYVTLCDLNMTMGSSHVLVDGSVTSSDLTYFSTAHYLDNRLGTNEDDGIVDHYKENLETLGYSVYCRVQYSGANTILQYWTFYYFNDGNLNRHEGDWEMTQVVLDPSLEPVSTTFSQHESGVNADWSDVETDGDHYKVYVARGSHANYYRSYSGALGLANDECGDDRKLTSDDYSIIMLTGSETWLNFMGRWGSNEGGDSLIGQAGPQGPMYRQDGDMWNGIYWSDSVSELNTDLLPAEWLFANFLWIYIAIIAILVALLAYRIYRRWKQGKVHKPFFGLIDLKGNKLRAAANVLAIAAIVIGAVSVFLPYYVVSLNIDSTTLTTEGFQDILVIDGAQGLRVNTLDAGAGLVQLTALPIPLSVILLTPLIFLVVGTIGVSDRKIALKLLTRGILMMLPVFIILAVIASLSSIYVYFPEEVAGVDDAKLIFDSVSASPFSGGETLYLNDMGEDADVRWGLGIGGYMLLGTGALLLVAAMLRFAAKGQASPGQQASQQRKEEMQWVDV